MNHLGKIIALAALLLCAACGFTPLYGTGDDQPGVTAELNQIHIQNIPDREGQYLRNALIDRFYFSGRPESSRYNLGFEPIKENITDLDITKSSDATRAQLRLYTTMVLTDRVTNRELLRRRLTSITSYNILQSQFTTRVSEENTRLNALDDIARQAEQQLSLYFRQRP